MSSGLGLSRSSLTPEAVSMMYGLAGLSAASMRRAYHDTCGPNCGCDRCVAELFQREPWCTALAVWALAQPDVGTVRPVLLPAMVAAKDVNVLVVVGAFQIGVPDHLLSVPVGIAYFCRPFTLGHCMPPPYRLVRNADPNTLPRGVWLSLTACADVPPTAPRRKPSASRACRAMRKTPRAACRPGPAAPVPVRPWGSCGAGGDRRPGSGLFVCR